MISFLTLAATATANAPTAATGEVPAADGMRFLVQLVAIIIIFYLFFIRPQQKRASEQLHMLSSLKIGDEVVVNGIIAKITRIISAGELEVQIADNVNVRVLRSAVSQVLVEKEDAQPLKKQKKK